MKLENLTEENLIEIVRLYEKHCGFNRNFEEAMYQYPSDILQHLKSRGWGEYRIGSKWEGQSKIWFETDLSNHSFSVRFSSNFDPIYRKGRIYKAAEKAGKIFKEEVNKYLNSQ